MKIQHSHFSKEFVNDYYLIHLIVILQNYMKSSRTKAHHIRLCDHPWDQFSYHTLEDDISWYPPDEQIMSYTLVNNHGRNHVQHLVRRVDYDTIPQWYQWEGSQGFKFFGVASPDATCKKIFDLRFLRGMLPRSDLEPWVSCSDAECRWWSIYIVISLFTGWDSQVPDLVVSIIWWISVILRHLSSVTRTL